MMGGVYLFKSNFQYSICIDCRMITNSGIGTYIKNLVPKIVKAKPHWHFDILIPKETDNVFFYFDKYKNCSIRICNEKIFSLFEQKMFFLLSMKKYDLLWVPNFNIPWIYRGKMLVTVHDVFHLARPEWAGSLLHVLYAKFMLNLVKKYATKVLTVSEFSKNELISLCGFSSEKIIVNSLGVDNFWFASDCEVEMLPYGKKYILFVGNIKPNKNLCGLIKAFNKVRDLVDFDLVIVGKKEGFMTGDESFLSEYNKNPSRIFFSGYVDDNKLREYYRHAEMLVFPSLYEGFGLPVLEAMACGCPVVCSDVASLPEVAGDAAVFFDPQCPDDMANKILLVNNSKNLRDRLVLHGKNRVASFKWEITAQNILSSLEMLLE